MQAKRSSEDSGARQALRPNWAVPEYRCSTCKGRRLSDFIELYYDATKCRWNRSCEVCRVKRRGDARRFRMMRSKAQSAKRVRARPLLEKADRANGEDGIEPLHEPRQPPSSSSESDAPAAKRRKAPAPWTAPDPTRPPFGATPDMHSAFPFDYTAYAAASSLPAHYRGWLPYNMMRHQWSPAYPMYPPQGYPFPPYQPYMAPQGYFAPPPLDHARPSPASAAPFGVDSANAQLSPSLRADASPHSEESGHSQTDLAVATAMASFGMPATQHESRHMATHAI